MTTPLRLRPRKKMSNFKFWTKSCRKRASGQFINVINMSYLNRGSNSINFNLFAALFCNWGQEWITSNQEMGLLHELLSRKIWKSEPVSNLTFTSNFCLGQIISSLWTSDASYEKNRTISSLSTSGLRMLWDKIYEDSNLFSLRNVKNNKRTASWGYQWVNAEQ